MRDGLERSHRVGRSWQRSRTQEVSGDSGKSLMPAWSNSCARAAQGRGKRDDQRFPRTQLLLGEARKGLFEIFVFR